MTSLALILPCLALLFLGYLFYRGQLIWWDMLGSLWGSPLPFATRATCWGAFGLLTLCLFAVFVGMSELFLFVVR